MATPTAAAPATPAAAAAAAAAGHSRQSILFASPLRASILLPADATATRPQLLADLCANGNSVALSDEHRLAPHHLMLSGQCVKKEDSWLEFRLKLQLLQPLKRIHFLLDVQYRTDKNAWDSSKLSSGSLFSIDTQQHEFLALRARQAGLQLCEQSASPAYRLRLELHVVALIFDPPTPLLQRVRGDNEPPDFCVRGSANSLELDVEGRRLFALAECLSCQSEFFAAKIAESRDAAIPLPGKRFAEMQLLLQLLYPGSKTRLSVEAAPGQLALADEFKIANLKETAVQVLVAAMRSGRTSPVQGFLLGRRHNSPALEACAVPLFAKLSLGQLQADAAFTQLPDSDRSLLLLKKVQHMEIK